MCQYPRQIEGQIRSQIRQIAYLNSKYRVMTKHYVSCSIIVHQLQATQRYWLPPSLQPLQGKYQAIILLRLLSINPMKFLLTIHVC